MEFANFDTSLARLLGLRDVCDVLNVSYATVRRLVAHGELPVVRVGRAVRVRPTDLRDFIDARTAPAISER